MKKLKNLLEDIAFESETPKVNKYEVIEGVSQYSVVGKRLYNETNLIQVADQLVGIAESAHSHILGEQDDWFDKVTVNNNMKNLKGNVVEFKKAAMEAHSLTQRMTGLYEDIGHILNRYYDINEGDLNDHDGEHSDMGGDEESAEEFLRNKEKSVKEELTSSDIGTGENQLDVNAGKSDPKLNKDQKYKDAVKETADRLKSRPKKRLKDIGLVDLAPVEFRNNKK